MRDGPEYEVEDCECCGRKAVLHWDCGLCSDCCDCYDGESAGLFDADELGLDPEEDDKRLYPK